MAKKALAAILVIFLALPGASAVESAGESADPEMSEILKKVYLAYGGKETLAKLGSSSLFLGQEKIWNEAGQEKNFRIRQIRKGKGLRFDLEAESGWTTTVFDGFKAWKMEGKTVTDLGDDETRTLSMEKDREPSVLTNFGDEAFKFKFLGRTVHNAVPAYAIEVTHGASTCTVFVDQKNYLVLAINYPGVDIESKQKASITTEYSEYRPSSGALVPFKQVQLVNDKKVFELSLENIDLSGVNEDELFTRPDRPFEVRLEKAMSLPFFSSHKEVVVKAQVGNGEPMNFLVDTGATQTVIDRRVAAENLLDRKQDVTGTAAGGVFLAQTTELPQLGLGGLKLGGVQAVIVDLSPQSRQFGKPIAGILGANVLSRFAVTLDYGKNQLILNDKDTYKAPAGANIVPYTDKKGPVIKAQINGKEEIPFLVDTGAIFNYLPAATAKKHAGNQAVRFTEGIGIDGRPMRLGVMQVTTMKVGTSIARDIAFNYPVSEDPKDKKGFVASTNQGILGNPFWQNYTLTIDYRMKHLVVQPNPLLASRQQLEQLVATGDKKLNIDHDYRAAETAYQQALAKVQILGDPKQQARIWGRLGNLRRAMARDLNRPEQSRVAFEYFSKAAEQARKYEDREIEGRVLGDWALLYMDNNRFTEARQALDRAIQCAPQDAQVNVDFAVYLFKTKLFGDMRGYIDNALFLEPSNWQALWYKLKLCEMFNDVPQQKAVLKDIVKHYPWSKLAQDKWQAVNNPQSLTPGATTPETKN